MINLNHREIKKRDVLNWSKSALDLLRRRPIDFLLGFLFSSVPFFIIVLLIISSFALLSSISDVKENYIALAFAFSFSFAFCWFVYIGSVLYDFGSYILTMVSERADNGEKINWRHELSVIFISDGIAYFKYFIPKWFRLSSLGIFAIMFFVCVLFVLPGSENKSEFLLEKNKTTEIFENKPIEIKKEKSALENTLDGILFAFIIISICTTIRFKKIVPLHYLLINKGYLTIDIAEEHVKKNLDCYETFKITCYEMCFYFSFFFAFFIPVLFSLNIFISVIVTPFFLSFFWAFFYVASRDLFLGTKENKKLESKIISAKIATVD